jgi:hypothetical protein
MVGEFDDIAIVVVQREERECNDECELMTPKRLKRYRKKGKRAQKQKGYTCQDWVRNDAMCPVDYFATSHITRVRLRGQSQLNPGPHQQIRIKIPIKGVKCTNLTIKRGKANQTIVEGVI